MSVKTFVYDVRGFRSGFASKIDADYAAWVAAVSPSAVTSVSADMSDDMLVITVHFTA